MCIYCLEKKIAENHPNKRLLLQIVEIHSICKVHIPCDQLEYFYFVIEPGDGEYVGQVWFSEMPIKYVFFTPNGRFRTNQIEEVSTPPQTPVNIVSLVRWVLSVMDSDSAVLLNGLTKKERKNIENYSWFFNRNLITNYQSLPSPSICRMVLTALGIADKYTNQITI